MVKFGVRTYVPTYMYVSRKLVQTYYKQDSKMAAMSSLIFHHLFLATVSLKAFYYNAAQSAWEE